MQDQIDLSIFRKFNFEYKPVGVKFLLAKPDEIGQLNKVLPICAMLKEAQDSDPFYVTKENQGCGVASLLMGAVEGDPIAESGQIGPKLGVYQDARANRRIYQQVPKLARNTANYVIFSSLDKLTFDPDLLIITAKPSQAEIIHRAVGYKTGAIWNAKGSTVAGCAWLYFYPYISGELNMLVSGLHHGMKSMQLFPEGLLFLSIPYDLLPGTVDSLNVMEWDLPQYRNGSEAAKKRMENIIEELTREMQK